MQPHRIFCNYLFTRRKTFFYVVSPEDDIVFRDRWLWPCVEYLDAIGVEEYELLPANDQSRFVKSLAVKKQE